MLILLQELPPAFPNSAPVSFTHILYGMDYHTFSSESYIIHFYLFCRILFFLFQVILRTFCQAAGPGLGPCLVLTWSLPWLSSFPFKTGPGVDTIIKLPLAQRVGCTSRLSFNWTRSNTHTLLSSSAPCSSLLKSLNTTLKVSI